jgi:hypothetical protein
VGDLVTIPGGKHRSGGLAACGSSADHGLDEQGDTDVMGSAGLAELSSRTQRTARMITIREVAPGEQPIRAISTSRP